MKQKNPFLTTTLLVISHTEHFLNSKKEVCGWIPTVRELDFLAGYFKEVIHIAVLHPDTAPPSTTGYVSKNVRFIGVPPFGGAGFLKKLSILWVIPLVIWKIVKLLPNIDVFQFRAPTSIGLAVIPFLTLFSRKKGWYKYAGNWMQPDMPLSYKAQKWLLEKWQKRPVTINGKWPGQPSHVHTFENPCLSEAELPMFKEHGERKVWQKPYTACFVGRMEDAKGVHRIIELLNKPGIEQTIATFHFVGDGPKMEAYKDQLQKAAVKTVFHGFCSREATFSIYAQSHLFLLPSDSEGFPKVVAEAAAFGCVPIVSDVSSVGQYINSGNGYLWRPQEERFLIFFEKENLAEEVLLSKSKNLSALADRFTFERYISNVMNILL